jgi:Protein of unknown function (DUF1579)
MKAARRVRGGVPLRGGRGRLMGALSFENPKGIVMTNQKKLATGLGLVLGASVMASTAMAQHDHSDHNKKDRKSSAMMEPASEGFNWQEYMTTAAKYAEPGERHRLLDPLVGNFNVEVKMWMDQSGEPMVSYSKMKSKWILGGRFVAEHYTAEFMGGEFEGMGLIGYDNYTKQYVSTWVDTMGTMTFQSHGTVDPTGKVFTFFSTYQDPAEDGRMVITKEVIKVINNDKYIMKMSRDTPTGEMNMVMEMTLTRVKDKS